MKPKYILVSIILGLLIVSLFFYPKPSQTKQICLEDFCFVVEIADTPSKKAKGLMYRTSLKDNEGMLFVFEKPGIYGFWMKNTFIPLDIIWLNENLEVVDIKENAQPCLKENCPIFKNSTPARYVLEIKGGKVEELGIQKGDKFNFLQ